jgi:dihydrodipicolinate synthase/N-acetylneuraminate lyase
MQRRDFLRSGLLLLGAAAAQPRILKADPGVAARLTPQGFRKRIVGPVLSAPTCYRKDLSLDFDGMRRIVELGVANGSQIVTLTAGNSQYDQLTFDEVKDLTQFLIDAVARRAVTIAATGAWPTEKAVEYAKFAAERGADALQVTMPALDDNAQVAHFEAIAKATPAGIVIHGQPSIDLMRRLLKIESIVAFKEEYSTLYTLPLYREFGDRLTLFAGGEKARLLTYWPYGMRAYYSTFMTFAPQVAVNFWKAVEANDLSRAGEIVLKYETPVFERFSHPFWRATLEHFEVASRWCRPAGTSFNDEQMQEVKALYDRLNLKPSSA